MQKKRGLKHQSHNVWKDKGGQEYNWNKVLKRFERIEGSKEEKHNEDELLKKKIADFYKEIEGQNVPESFIKNAINLIKQNHKNDKSGDYAIKARNKSKKDSDKLKNIWKSYNK